MQQARPPRTQGAGHRRLLRAPVVIPTLVAATALVAVVLVLFQPWKLVVDETVDEALPTVVAGTSVAPPAPAGSSTQQGGPTGAGASAARSQSPSPVRPVRLAAGTFVSHEHATRGKAVVLRLPDGSRVLRLEGLDTSNGPDLHVWLSDQAVTDGPSGWTVFDDGSYVDLGRLKGNRGSQNYAIPAAVDLRSLSSVSVWCARFRVSFGAAALVGSGTAAPGG